MSNRPQEFHSPPRNMVQEVRNIIEGYKMGPLRALAQDPVQNSYDAGHPNRTSAIGVEYQLHRRDFEGNQKINLLTITDWNTTGLRGPALSQNDLHKRAQATGYLQLEPHENWAAWEAMGYTKVGEDFLGSRGQGKASCLYHSRHPTGLRGPDGRILERMLILYDTLLEDGTYRLGVRLARPADNVLFPPYQSHEAKALVQDVWKDWEGPPISLNLSPLHQVGTRIIIPFLSREALEGFRSGEMIRWLERCWWRAIQAGELEIFVVSETSNRERIGVPSWWTGEPWVLGSGNHGVFVRRDLPLEPDSPLQIKQIVCFHTPELQPDEIEGVDAQYSGVQLLRHNSWIETLGVAERFGDYVPRDKRAGFRGFVEFNLPLERQLRGAESPQHDAFTRHRTFVRQIDVHIEDTIRDFAESQGWLGRQIDVVEEDRGATAMLERIVQAFVPEEVRRGKPPIVWECSLTFQYPRVSTSRINWGEAIGNIVATCIHSPADKSYDVKFDLIVVDPDGNSVNLLSGRSSTIQGEASFTFGNMKIVKHGEGDGLVECSRTGIHRLKLQCSSGGVPVATTYRTFSVEADPPVKKTRPISMAITIRNTSANRKRVNYGESIDVEVNVKGRAAESIVVTVDANLGVLPLLAGETVEISRGMHGEPPFSTTLACRGIQVVASRPSSASDGRFVVLQPGRHPVTAQVRDQSGQIVASASAQVYVEIEPDEPKGALPFEIRAREDAMVAYPEWELEPPHGEEDRWILWYSKTHPAYEDALATTRRRLDATGLFGIKLYWAELFCSALAEWSLALYQDRGDEGGFHLLSGGIVESSDPLWERYHFKVQELMESYEDALACLDLERELVSIMLHLLERGIS